MLHVVNHPLITMKLNKMRDETTNTKDFRTLLDEIASRFFISKYYLSRLFKQVTRTTIFDYIANCKLNKAIRCLQHTDKTVNEIALECGFNSTAYFCKIFRSAMGVTPGRYRIILKEEGERPFQD